MPGYYLMYRDFNTCQDGQEAQSHQCLLAEPISKNRCRLCTLNPTTGSANMPHLRDKIGLLYSMRQLRRVQTKLQSSLSASEGDTANTATATWTELARKKTVKPCVTQTDGYERYTSFEGACEKSKTGKTDSAGRREISIDLICPEL